MGHRALETKQQAVKNYMHYQLLGYFSFIKAIW